MSIYLEGFTEAKINGQWVCIDFHQYGADGKLHHIPCIAGQSLIGQALEWGCDMQRIGAPTDLSDEVRKLNTSEEGVLYGTGKERYTLWYIVEGSWFMKVNLNMPDCCGFFPRQAVGQYLANPSENKMDPEEMLSIEDYQALDPEVKKAYQYFEYTEPYGDRSILREFKEAVLDRISAYNEHISWQSRGKDISLADVRVLITES